MSKNTRFYYLLGITLSVLLLSIASVYAAEEVEVTDVPVELNHYQLGMMTSYRSTQGSFDPYGAYSSYPNGSAAISMFATINFSYRVSQDWEAGLSLPIRQSRMITPSGDSASTSVGGFGGDVRYHVGGWPHLVLHGGVGTPWSWRNMKSNGDPRASLSQDDIGDGFLSGTSIRLGAGVSRSFHPFRLAFDLSTGIPIGSSDYTGDGPTQVIQQLKRGKRIQAMEGLSYTLSHEWNLNTGLRQAWGQSTSVDDVPLDGTASRLFTANIGLSYSPNHDWRVTGGFDSPWPFYAYAVNQGYSPAISLSMMYMGI